MKIHLYVLFSFFSFYAFAQNKLVFDKKFVHSEDKWVAFPADSTGSHPFGFIYIDAQAGMTLNYEGSFKIDEKGNFKAGERDRTSSIKYRLEPNDMLIAFIPENKFPELGVTKTPDWLQIYKEGENTVARQYRWGYFYNAWGECKKALEFLDRAQKIDPKYDGLATELAYSYNCLKEYDKAIKVLYNALNAKAPDAYTVKELIYAQAKKGNLKDAEATLKKYEQRIEDRTYAEENAYNILQGYFINKDKPNFNRWLSISNLTESSKFGRYVEQMIAELK